MSTAGKPAVQVAVGDTVKVVEFGARSENCVSYRVTKVARVWITVVRLEDGRRERRFRLDDQTDGSAAYAYGARFFTLEQWDERDRHNTDLRYLRDQGISVDYTSPWRNRQSELADLLRSVDMKTEGE